MADDSDERERKKRKEGNGRKLFPGDKIEELIKHKELGWCWREIRLPKERSSDSAVEGNSVSMRPRPPPLCIYGLCVDVSVDDVWLEGVVFDHKEGSNQQLILFPDKCTEQMIAFDRLRPTQEWNESSNAWWPRGKWLFLKVFETFEREDPLAIWDHLRTTEAFREEIKVWSSGSLSTWHKLVSNFIRKSQPVSDALPFTEPLPSDPLVDAYMAFNGGGNSRYLNTETGLYCLGQHEHEDVSLAGFGDSTQGAEGNNIQNQNCKAGFTSASVVEKSWKPVELEAEECHDWISVFMSYIKHNEGKGPKTTADHRQTRLKLKRHLLFLDWKIDFRTNDKSRFRYLSPEGKTKYSLRLVCSDLVMQKQNNDQKGRDETSSGQGQQGRSMVQEEDANNENAIRRYKNFFDLKKENKHDRQLISEAKAHLKLLGWEMRKGEKELCYFPPGGGKPYISLYSACTALLEGRIPVSSNQ